MYNDDGQPIAFIEFHTTNTSFDNLRELVDAVDDYGQRGLRVEHVTFEFGRDGERDTARVYFCTDRIDTDIDTESSSSST